MDATSETLKTVGHAPKHLEEPHNIEGTIEGKKIA